MKTAHGIGGLLVASIVLAASSRAEAADGAKGFGDKGQLIISADRLLPVISHTYASTTETRNGVELTHSRSVTGLSLFLGRNVGADADANVPINVHTIPRVAFDVSVIDHLTVGAALAFGFGLGGTVKQDNPAPNGKTTTQTDAPSLSAIGVAPRVGYVLSLTDLFAFWLRAGIGFYSVSSSYQRVNNNAVTDVKDSDTIFSLDLDPQFAIVPFEHFFITVGPLVNIPITGTRSHSETTGANKTTLDIDLSLFHIGLSAGIGGWFNVF